MIYIVSGYMRSGTSMMMQCLEAGGMPVLKSPERDRLNECCSDQHYRPNPVSLYEPQESDMRTHGWPRHHDGKVIKVVAPFICSLSVHDYCIVVMRRNHEEIRQSYNAAFGKRVPSSERISGEMISLMERLHNRKDVRHIIEVNYQDVIADPQSTFKMLASHGWTVDAEAAASIVNPALYRFRLERLVVGL